MNASTTRVRLFSMTGKLLRESADVNTAGNAAGLPRGIYILQIRNGSITSQKIIQVK